MKEIPQIIWFRLKLMLTDKALLAAILAAPLLLTLLLGGMQGYNKPKLIPVAVADQDKSDFSRLVIERLAAKEGLKVISSDEASARNMVQNYAAEAAFIIKKGFEAGILAGNADSSITIVKSPQSLAYGLIQDTLAGEVARISANTSAANWVSREFREYGLSIPGMSGDIWDSAWKYADSLWEPEPLLRLEYKEIQGSAVEEVKPVSLLQTVSTGMLLVFILLLAMFNSSWLIEEKSNSTLKRLIMVPGLLGKSFGANFVAVFLAACGQTALFEICTRLLFGPAPEPFGPKYLVISAYVFGAASFGMLLSAWARSLAQLQAAAAPLVLFTSFIGGCFWGFLDPPPLLRLLSLFTPQGWALHSLLGILAGTSSLREEMATAAVLVSTGIISLAVAYLGVGRSVRAL